MFKTYSPPEQRNDFFYPCLINYDLVTSCPKEYSQWAISTHCRDSPTSFVSKDHKIFKNFYCAICNLGYIWESALLLPDFLYRITNLSDQIPSLGKRVIVGYVISSIIRLSYQSKQCCRVCDDDVGELCYNISINNNLWGNILVVEHGGCISAPFNTTCSTNFTILPSTLEHNMDVEFLCPHTEICKSPQRNECSICSSNNTKPVILSWKENTTLEQQNLETSSESDGTQPVLAELLSAKKVVTKELKTTAWLQANESFQFCTNRSILGNSSENYNKIFLSPSRIQVGDLNCSYSLYLVYRYCCYFRGNVNIL